MEINIENLIEIIKEQVQMFLLDSGEFYPFGTCVDGEIISFLYPNEEDTNYDAIAH